MPLLPWWADINTASKRDLLLSMQFMGEKSLRKNFISDLTSRSFHRSLVGFTSLHLIWTGTLLPDPPPHHNHWVLTIFLSLNIIYLPILVLVWGLFWFFLAAKLKRNDNCIRQRCFSRQKIVSYWIFLNAEIQNKICQTKKFSRNRTQVQMDHLSSSRSWNPPMSLRRGWEL